MASLRRGDETRIARVELRKRTARGEANIYDLITYLPDEVVKVSVVKLLAWTPGIGPAKSRALLKNIEGLPDMTIPIGKLGLPRRESIMERMRSGVPGVTPIP